ncbi:MAG: signal recognition particle-docking protein FtsY [Planctomycetota bacterium]|nr:signal recognition particle-docking protein FtsY [Planctomycetota bacterium]MDA1105953.1 signal recognition particle-docking protein FtsY [Planctomycetota bacterium]
MFKRAWGALRQGLAKTADALGGKLRALLHGRRLDAATLDEVERLLISADVGVKAAAELTASLRAEFAAGTVERGEDAIEHLKKAICARCGGRSTAIAVAERSPTVILVVGINGVGKTTSVAKIAHSLRSSGKSVLLAAADTFRAGAVKQLTIWSERLGVDIVRGKDGADPASVVFDAAEAAVARGVDVLLVDTAGRLHTQEHLMRQLTKLRSVLERKIPGAPHETLLVIDATSGQNAIRQAELFSKAAGVTGIFLAKLDGTAKGGVVVAIGDEMGIPVKLVGTGETPEDVQPFDPASFVEAMLGAPEGPA